ncbi:hypothetical protein [Pasteurella oralis]|uniref:hypothetical protein n=1 Tax=Pasteurella oralis TaxID=1071947 RepID=UPI000C7BD829|nr:hypothetical protein [Pasteurella oralis]
MSRSYKKTKIFGFTSSDSDREGKKLNHRKFRQATRLSLINNKEPPCTLNALYTESQFPKDGKHYWASATKRDMVK